MLHSGIVKFQLQDFFPGDDVWARKEQRPNGCRAGTHEGDFLVETEQIRPESTNMDTHTPFFTSSFFSSLCVKFGYLNEIWITEGFTKPQSSNMTCLGRVLHVQGGRQKNSMWFNCLPMCCALGNTYWGVIEFYLLNSSWTLLYSSLIYWNLIFHPTFWYLFSKWMGFLISLPLQVDPYQK